MDIIFTGNDESSPHSNQLKVSPYGSCKSCGGELTFEEIQPQERSPDHNYTKYKKMCIKCGKIWFTNYIKKTLSF